MQLLRPVRSRNLELCSSLLRAEQSRAPQQYDQLKCPQPEAIDWIVSSSPAWKTVTHCWCLLRRTSRPSSTRPSPTTGRRAGTGSGDTNPGATGEAKLMSNIVIHGYTCDNVMWLGYTCDVAQYHRNLWQMWPLSFSHNYNPLCNDSAGHWSAVTRPRPVSGL